MYPRYFAETSPNKAAVILGSAGTTLTYGELENRANQAAHAFRRMGLKPGDRVAFALENCLEIFPFVWGAQRSGLYYVAVSSRLKTDEIAYIVEDSGSKLLLASDYVGADVLDGLGAALGPSVERFKIGDAYKGWRDWNDVLDGMPTTPITDECLGSDMLYSSGTTGRPKGILHKVDHRDPPDTPPPSLALVRDGFGLTSDSVYLCPAPLYHAAPLRWSMWAQMLGATVIVMEKYDPEQALRLIETCKVTHGQFVPTHFIRMLKLDNHVRQAYDVSSLKLAIHAAAPCPKPVKEAMIDWWGPILVEYYAGSEGNGMTMISSQEWLSHPGSVGRAVIGEVRICDDRGEPLPPGEEGGVFFAGGSAFEYHNDPDKTAQATNKYGWTSLGDVGKLDEEGYLYLTDRKSFMIISGGVNIYPQEIESLLVTHPKVADVAVIGAPDPDFGEKVVAVVQPRVSVEASQALADELIQFCRASLSGVKVPRQIDFSAALPRADTGKLYKRLIRDEYWRDERG